jgi:hypothetical protein
VLKEFLLVYAMQHHVNIYVLEIYTTQVLKADGQIESLKARYTVDLVTPESLQGDQPIKSDRPNIIAVQFHSIAVNQRSADGATAPSVSYVGHYEYIIDKNKHSLWRHDDPTVTKLLQPAHLESLRTSDLNQYQDKFKAWADKNLLASLDEFKVGEIATMMITDHVRSRSHWNKQIDAALRNMYVKIIDEPNPAWRPRRYRVVSHAGVIKELIRQDELRPLGQDVDLLLRGKLDRVPPRREQVAVITAWNFWIDRNRAVRHSDALPAAAAAVAVNASPVQSQRSAVRSLPSELPAPRGKTRQATIAAHRSAHQPVYVCASCAQTIDQPAGVEVSKCVECQQTMHSVATQCSQSSTWTRFEGWSGWTCSVRCTNLLYSWEAARVTAVTAAATVPLQTMDKIIRQTASHYKIQWKHVDGGIPEVTSEPIASIDTLAECVPMVLAWRAELAIREQEGRHVNKGQ